MSFSLYVVAALFLPLFPLSMVFNLGFTRLRHPISRALLLLIWPQIGLFLVAQAATPSPDWFVAWALLTAVLYAYRAIAVREVGLWIGFVATSAWALLWLAGGGMPVLHIQALAFSVPLVMLSLLTTHIERRFGAANTRLNLGLATLAPRYAGVFTVAMLAAVATPLFPNFFTMLATIATQTGSDGAGLPVVAMALATVWLLWSWSGVRLLQGMVVGGGREDGAEDMSVSLAWVYAAGFLILAGAGLKLAEVLL